MADSSVEYELKIDGEIEGEMSIPRPPGSGIMKSRKSMERMRTRSSSFHFSNEEIQQADIKEVFEAPERHYSGDADESIEDAELDMDWVYYNCLEDSPKLSSDSNDSSSKSSESRSSSTDSNNSTGNLRNTFGLGSRSLSSSSGTRASHLISALAPVAELESEIDIEV